MKGMINSMRKRSKLTDKKQYRENTSNDLSRTKIQFFILYDINTGNHYNNSRLHCVNPKSLLHTFYNTSIQQLVMAVKTWSWWDN